MQDLNYQFQKTNEVAFVNHIYEFIRFYAKHKSFCDEISGIKERVIIEDGKERKFRIKKENFSFAIKKLTAFVMDNLHYVKDVEDMRLLEKEVASIELEFNNDKEYEKLSESTNRSRDQEIILQTKYLQYLLKCYKIGNVMQTLLQSSLMIGTKDMKKAITYFNDTPFFENLSRYRDEVSENLANFKIRNLYDHIKYIVGYYYTYRILISNEEADVVNTILDNLIPVSLDPEMIHIVMDLGNRKGLTNSEMELAKIEARRFKKTLSKIYYITNKALSEKNILPKVKERIKVDTTLI